MEHWLRADPKTEGRLRRNLENHDELAGALTVHCNDLAYLIGWSLHPDLASYLTPEDHMTVRTLHEQATKFSPGVSRRAVTMPAPLLDTILNGMKQSRAHAQAVDLGYPDSAVA